MIYLFKLFVVDGLILVVVGIIDKMILGIEKVLFYNMIFEIDCWNIC